jgi:hypothetical protein
MNTDKKKVQDIAKKIIDQVPQDPEKFSFVITVLMVISIILTTIRIIQECNKSKIGKLTRQEKQSFFGEQIKSLSLKRSWFTRMTVKKAIRKQLPKELYKEYGGVLMNAILNTGEKLTEEEIQSLVEASNV